MSSNKKRFSLGWITGIALGIGSSGALVYAVTVPNSFTDGTTASAAQVNANFVALQDAVNGLPGQTCVGNSASDEMVRVGSACVDKNPASLFDGNAATSTALGSVPVACLPNGSGCSGVFAQSRATPGTVTSITWAQAAVACANAGKRLITPSQLATAFALGVAALADGNSEWVDIVVAAGGGTGTTNNTGSGGNGTFGVGKMGPAIGSTGNSGAGVLGFLAVDRSIDPPAATVGFRCAR
jgi:hypothetical protein